MGWHKGLRLAYVAQHSMVHLGDYLSNTPLEYLQMRFRRGYDIEAPRAQAAKLLTRKEEEHLRMLGLKHGKKGKPVEALLSRLEMGEGSEKECLYEVK